MVAKKKGKTQDTPNHPKSNRTTRRFNKQRDPLLAVLVLGVVIGVVCCAGVSVGVRLQCATVDTENIPSAPDIAPSVAPPIASEPAPDSASLSNHDPAASIPPAAAGCVLSLVLDDAGGDVEALRHCLALPFPITVAVMPGLSHSRECADIARNAGAEVLLHQPMQAQNLDISPGPKAVTPAMTAAEAAELVTSNMKSLGKVDGVNNHEGSLITENEQVMAAVMQAAKAGGAYFLDSRTTSKTRVEEASATTNIPYYKRDVFLDNSHDRDAIIEQVSSALAIANKNKAVIMIGHVRSDDALVSTLQEIAPTLQRAGYTFCTVSQTGALMGNSGTIAASRVKCR